LTPGALGGHQPANQPEAGNKENNAEHHTTDTTRNPKHHHLSDIASRGKKAYDKQHSA
jgi:hypothetical protein